MKAPNPKNQAPKKLQIPNPKNSADVSAFFFTGAWGLMFLWSLGLGAWNFNF